MIVPLPVMRGRQLLRFAGADDHRHDVRLIKCATLKKMRKAQDA